MRTIIALLAFASIAAADEPPMVTPPMVTRVVKVLIPQPEPSPALSANIFADYPAEKLLAALQPKAKRVAMKSNEGWCPCQAKQAACYCQPASICPNGCPAVVNLRKDEVKYFFPAFDPNCPTGR